MDGAIPDSVTSLTARHVFFFFFFAERVICRLKLDDTMGSKLNEISQNILIVGVSKQEGNIQLFELQNSILGEPLASKRLR